MQLSAGRAEIAEIEKLMGDLQEVKISAIRGRANSARDGPLYEPHSDGFGPRALLDTTACWVSPPPSV
jgi:hypothetical protein